MGLTAKRMELRRDTEALMSKEPSFGDWERYLWLIALGPILWLQGKYVRRVTPKLPEPEGPREGVTGQGPVLRLLIAGDSAAAGVGAASQDKALCGQLVQRLSERFTVNWQLRAVTGLTSPELVQMLSSAAEQPFDVVVLSIGVNDVTNLMSPTRWVQWQERLAELIRVRYQPRVVVHSAVPPMHGFTALPQPLRWFMGRWAVEMNRRLDAALGTDPQRTLLWPFLGVAQDGLATDGFHPGPAGYQMWAAELCKLILSKQKAWT
jgi:lysophospholipase L1-like esterase